MPRRRRKVLVVDPEMENIRSARLYLSSNTYELVAVQDYEYAMRLVRICKFDTVLTRLHIPFTAELGSEPMPIGMLLACEAARYGAWQVGVVDDLRARQDPLATAFISLEGKAFKLNGAQVFLEQAQFHANGSVDWEKMLEPFQLHLYENQLNAVSWREELLMKAMGQK